jgi:hypothetical protein
MISNDLGNFVMPSNPDDERVVDLKLTMQIVTRDEDANGLLPVENKRLIASYCALFKQCKNDIANLAPATSGFTKNLNKNGYIFTSVIQSVRFQKHTENSAQIHTIAEYLAQLRGISLEAVAAQTTANAMRVFNIEV